MLNYESSRKTLPPSGLVRIHRDSQYEVDIFNPLGGTRFSWIVEVLPFMEEQSLFDKFDHSKQIVFQDQNPQATSIATLLCPSDEAGGRFYEYRDSEEDIVPRVTTRHSLARFTWICKCCTPVLWLRMVSTWAKSRRRKPDIVA